MDKFKLRYFIREAIEKVANVSSTFSVGDKVTTVDGDTATVTMAEHPFYTVELESTGTTKSFSFTELAPYEEKIIAKTSEAKDEDAPDEKSLKALIKYLKSIDHLPEAKDKDGIKYAIATNMAKYGRPFSKKGDKRSKLTKGLEKEREKHIMALKKNNG
jgi:preprotein translocase subunit YajC